MAKAGLQFTAKAPSPKRVTGAMTGFLSVLETEVVDQANKTLEKLAKLYVAEVIRVIESQAYNWKPLSDRYAAHKKRNDLDPRTYIATGFFLEHVVVWKDSKGRLHAGLRPNVIHPDAKMPLVKLARIHEFGIGNNPARPLWRTALSVVLRANKRFAQQYQRHVKKAVRAKVRNL